MTALTGLHKYIVRAVPYPLAIVIVKLLQVICPVETLAVTKGLFLTIESWQKVLETYQVYMFVSIGKVWTIDMLSQALSHWFEWNLNVLFCYDSFFSLRHLSPDLLLFPSYCSSGNTFHLNTASLLHSVHGPIAPFPLTLYGCLLVSCIASTQPHPFYRTSSFPFISDLALVLRTLLGLCAAYPLI